MLSLVSWCKTLIVVIRAGSLSCACTAQAACSCSLYVYTTISMGITAITSPAILSEVRGYQTGGVTWTYNSYAGSLSILPRTSSRWTLDFFHRCGGRDDGDESGWSSPASHCLHCLTWGSLLPRTATLTTSATTAASLSDDSWMASRCDGGCWGAKARSRVLFLIAAVPWLIETSPHLWKSNKKY